MKKPALFILLAAVAAILLLAYSQWDTPPSERREQDTRRRVSVTDSLNRRVEIAVPVHRAVVLVTNAANIIYTLGAFGRVVGVTRHIRSSPLLTRLIPHLESIPSPGSSWETNIEELLSLEPDVVIMWARHEQPVSQIEARGVPVIGVLCSTMDDICSLTELLGKIFEREEKARRVIEQIREIINLVGERVKGVREATKPGVYWAWCNPLQTSSSGLPAHLTQLAGGRNVAEGLTHRNPRVTLEQIIGWDPEVVLIVDYAKYDAAELVGKAGWSVMAAARSGRVYKLPALLATDGPGAALVLLQVAMWLYPERFRDIEFEAEADRFFNDCYSIPFPRTMRGGEERD